MTNMQVFLFEFSEKYLERPQEYSVCNKCDLVQLPVCFLTPNLSMF
jgi:hypothetical protein